MSGLRGVLAEVFRPERRERTPAEDRASVPVAALAALAESGVIFIPVHLLAQDSAKVTAGPLSGYPLFILAFVGAVCLATLLRRSVFGQSLVPLGAGLIGLAQGLVWGSGTFEGTATTIALSLFVAFRIVTLAIRDWREPVGDSFGIGAAALAIEIAFARPGGPTAGLLPAVVPMFFLASLASRAASVRLATPRAEIADRASAVRWFRGFAVPLGLLFVLLAAAFGLGLPHGPFQHIGALLYAGWSRLVVLLGYLLAKVLLHPTYWLFTKLHIDLSGLQRVAQRLSDGGVARGKPGDLLGSSWVERILGFAFFALLLYLLVRTIRHRWKELEPPSEAHPEPPPSEAGRLPAFSRERLASRLRRELPADTVRRWYAEALLLLERKGLTKPPSGTPGEYLREVTTAFPESGVGFTALTRAYEDVRYGSLALDRASLDRLDVHRTMAMEALKRAELPAEP
jgi:hypothetical protein